MKTERLVSIVLTTTVILGIVGCRNQSFTEISENETEITASTEQAIEETSETTEEIQATPTPRAAATPKPTEEMGETEESLGESTVSTAPSESSTVPTETSTTVSEAQPAEEPPAPTQAPTATSEPTATPSPTEPPVSTSTPTPEPITIDIEASAQANGYVAIDIDMGNGTTQRIYGYYVDMSGLDSMVNDYRESIGLSRLPTDTNHIEEMKIRAAEITIPGYFSHQRPNGSWGSEANIVSGTDASSCYSMLYDSDGHRAAWEDEYATTIYSVGFRRMVFDESTGTWSGGGGATVQFTDYSF